MQLMRGLVMAFTTYSRIPMPQVQWSEENRRYALCFFPLIGVVIGLIEALWFLFCGQMQVGALLRAVVGTLIPLIVTGGIHMDGFLDTSDALAAWQGRERRLKILKDSHVGAFAVIRFGEYALLMTALLAEIPPQCAWLLLPGFVASRALSAIAAVTMKDARGSGMLAGFTHESDRRAIVVSGAVFLALCLALLLILRPVQAALSALACALSFLLYKHMAYKNFGGVTGDLAGWFLQMTELMYMASLWVGGLIR